MATKPEAAPRRLPSDERREQLSRIAMAVAAERGYTGTTLDEVAERAGVTRNLLYHYFPRGRLDVFMTAVERAGEELTEGWVTEPGMTQEERFAANLARLVEHALEPSDAWKLLRQSTVPGEPEIEKASERYRDVVLDSVALNNFGRADVSPLARAAIGSYMAFFETTLDECRAEGLDRDEVGELLAAVLRATVAEVGRIESR